MSTLSLVSNNPHAHCDSGSPCPTCAPKYQPVMPSIAGKTPQQVAAEQAARERHPAKGVVVTEWTCYTTPDQRVVLDTRPLLDDEWLGLLDHLLSAWREVRDDLAGQRVSGEPEAEDYEHPALLACVQDIHDHLMPDPMRRDRSLAMAMALQRHASALPVEDES